MVYPYYGILFGDNKNNKLSSQKNTWMNFNVMLLSERIKYEKATYYMIPITWYSRKNTHNTVEIH